MQTRSTSTELSGGEGFTYEDGVVAYYLAALLCEDAAAGLLGSVARVCVQQKAQGEPLDDVIVDSVTDGEERRLSLQVKRSLTISSTDQDFKSIIKQAVETRAKLNFRVGADRYGFAVRAVALGRFNSLERIIARAKASTNGAEFVARFVAGAESSQDDINLREELLAILASPDADSEADFYRHFVALNLNGFEVGGNRYTDLTNRLGQLVSQGQTGAALTAILARHARLGAGCAKIWTRPALLADLRQEIRLKVVPSYAADIQTLTNEAKAAVKDIRDDIDGIVIDRSLLANNAFSFTEKSKLVNISGLPGCGKSVVLRRMVERSILEGPVFFLKSDRLAGTTWHTYATSLRLQHKSLTDLLAEIGSSGTPIFFIDGVDRIKTEQRKIVTDILHALETEQALSHWRVVVSSRDQGLEVFRSWLPASFYRETGISDVSVSALDESETEQLATQKPALKSLLFGSDAVKEISRRPFFAAVLADKIASGGLDGVAHPQTESELIEIWWRGGGFNADPQQAYLRQRALLDLAETGAPKLGKEVLARQLQSPTHQIVPDLQHDHIIVQVQVGTSFSFAHDIFFEWAFFRLLIDKDDQWIGAIKTAGEPPLLARIVSLFSQHLLETNTAWRKTFEKLDAATLRPQWRRAWLLGPPSSTRFMEHLPTIEPLLSENNYEFLKKFLVWFQAERTVPNPLVLSKPQAGLDGQRIIQMADLVGWPSDVRAWQRVIVWLIKREADFPANIMPLIVELFNVWQNMFLDMPNWVSEKVIAITESWLGSFKDRHEEPYAKPQPPSRWDGLDHKTRDALKKTLRGLILRSARSYPEAAKRILHKAILLSRSKRDRSLFDEIVMFAPILATTCPEQLADLVRADVIDVLPKDEIEAEDRKREEHFDYLKAVRAKPANERAESETRMLAHPTPFIFGQDHYDLDDVGINGHQQAFNPTSPLRQPFASLFEHAPDIARRLVRDITNHAVEGWLQVHEINRSRHGGRYGKPLPIELSFPWGNQQFWGNAREYAWFLGQLGPQPIEAGLFAMTYWAHKQLDEGRDVDALLQEILEGHKSCAVLGLAASLVIEKSHVSFSALPLVTSQRLWHMDIQRQAQGAMPEIDFMGINAHIRAQKTQEELAAEEYLKARRFRVRTIHNLSTLYALSDNSELCSTFKAALQDFPNTLPYTYEEEKTAENDAHYLEKAQIWAGWGDSKNYRTEEIPGREDVVAITYQSPEPLTENLEQRQEENGQSLRDISMVSWANRSLQANRADSLLTMESAIAFAKSRDSDDLFISVAGPEAGFKQSCIAAAAVMATRFSENTSDIEWGWSVMARVSAIKEKEQRLHYGEDPSDPRRYLLAALFADIRKNTPRSTSASELLSLAASPNPNISLAAFNALLLVHVENPLLSWVATCLATDLASDYAPTYSADGNANTSKQDAYRHEKQQKALENLAKGDQAALAMIPKAWVLASPRPRYGRDLKDDDEKIWQHPEFDFNPEFAAKVFCHFPINAWCSQPERRAEILDYLDSLAAWTIDRLFPAWQSEPRKGKSRGHNMHEWIRVLPSLLVQTLPYIHATEFIKRFVEPFSRYNEDDGLAVVAAIAGQVVYRQVFDAPVLTDDALMVLESCLERMLKERVFDPDTYHAGEVHGYAMPEMIRDIMLVSINVEAPGAARFANGNWSELPRYLPVIDAFMEKAGWVPLVISNYLTLCDRAGKAFPIDCFAKHVSASLDGLQKIPHLWTGLSIPAHISGVVQSLAEYNQPLSRIQARELLVLLDRLVDLGDRRASALEQSEYFRGIQEMAANI